MKDQNVFGIILEGIAGTGKSTTLAKLLDSDLWRTKPYMSSIVLSEHQTLRNLETKRDNSTYTKQDSIRLLDNHVSYLELLKNQLDDNGWLKRDRKSQKIPYVFERFHLSHVYYYDSMNWDDVVGIDERLVSLNAHLFVFTINPDDIQDRIIDDYEKTGWSNYLSTLGSTNEEIKEYFIRKQDEILELAKKTKLKVTYIDTSKLSPNEVVQEIITNWDFGL